MRFDAVCTRPDCSWKQSFYGSARGVARPMIYAVELHNLVAHGRPNIYMEIVIPATDKEEKRGKSKSK